MTDVLIVSARGDYSAEQVAEQLAVRGHAYTWFDPADFPQRLSLSATFEPLSDSAFDTAWWVRGVDDDGTFGLDDVRSVYYRRPGDFVMPEGLSGPELRFARSQARVGLGGILASYLPGGSIIRPRSPMPSTSHVSSRSPRLPGLPSPRR